MLYEVRASEGSYLENLLFTDLELIFEVESLLLKKWSCLVVRKDIRKRDPKLNSLGKGISITLVHP